MRTATFRDLSVVDPVLPQLNDALDVQFMGATFADRVLGQPVRACRVLQARYKPRRNCLVSYLVTPEDSRSQPEIVSIRMVGPGHSSGHFAKALASPWITEMDGPLRVFCWPDEEIIGYRFPADRKLKTLGRLTALRETSARLTPVLDAAYGGESPRIEGRVVHYVAEHTCTLRVDLWTAGTSSASPLHLFAKTYGNNAGQITWSRMQRLYRSDTAGQGVTIAKPVAYDAGAALLWQEEIQGAVIDPTLGANVFSQAMALTGKAAAQFHQFPTNGELETSSDPQERILAAIDTIVLVRPDLEDRLRRLAALLARRSPGRSAERRLLHGDLHLKNCIHTGTSIAFIDLDNVRIGDPLEELGSFAAGVYAQGLRHDLRATDVDAAVDAFIDAYSAEANLPIDLAAVRWHGIAALLAERCLRAVTRLRIAGDPRLLDRLVAETEARAEVLR